MTHLPACVALALLLAPASLFSRESPAINVVFAVSDREMQQFRETACFLSFIAISNSGSPQKDHIDWLPLHDYVANKPAFRVNAKLRPGRYAVALRFSRTGNLDFHDKIPLKIVTVSNVSNKFILCLPSLWSMSVTLEPDERLGIDEKWSLEIHSRDQRYAANLTLSWNDGKLTGDWLDAIENEAFSFSIHSSAGKHFYLGLRKIGAGDLMAGRIGFALEKAR